MQMTPASANSFATSPGWNRKPKKILNNNNNDDDDCTTNHILSYNLLKHTHRYQCEHVELAGIDRVTLNNQVNSKIVTR